MIRYCGNPTFRSKSAKRGVGTYAVELEIGFQADNTPTISNDGGSTKMKGIAMVTGWKDIANYLQKGVRTVQRYERELGLPVRRPAGKATGSVMATKSELDAWV